MRRSRKIVDGVIAQERDHFRNEGESVHAACDAIEDERARADALQARLDARLAPPEELENVAAFVRKHACGPGTDAAKLLRAGNTGIAEWLVQARDTQWGAIMHRIRCVLAGDGPPFDRDRLPVTMTTLQAASRVVERADALDERLSARLAPPEGLEDAGTFVLRHVPHAPSRPTAEERSERAHTLTCVENAVADRDAQHAPHLVAERTRREAAEAARNRMLVVLRHCVVVAESQGYPEHGADEYRRGQHRGATDAAAMVRRVVDRALAVEASAAEPDTSEASEAAFDRYLVERVLSQPKTVVAQRREDAPAEGLPTPEQIADALHPESEPDDSMATRGARHSAAEDGAQTMLEAVCKAALVEAGEHHRNPYGRSALRAFAARLRGGA